MKKPSVGFDPFDVVVVPFPFADRRKTTPRPAVVLTSDAKFGQLSGTAILAMITSAKQSAWPFDVPILDLNAAGLQVPCLVRGKVNSIDLRLIDRKIGTLGAEDRLGVSTALRELLAGVLG